MDALSDPYEELKESKNFKQNPTEKKANLFDPSNSSGFMNEDKEIEGNRNFQNGDVDQLTDEDPLSPDISLTSQKTLRYSDVEAELKEHNRSRESSDSIETLEDLPHEDSHIQFNQRFLEQLTLTHNISGSSSDSLEKAASLPRGSSTSEDNISGGSHEVLSEFSNAPPRPGSLSLPRPLQAIERERTRTKSQTSTGSRKSIKSTENTESSGLATGSANISQSAPQAVPLEAQGAHHIDTDGVSRSLPHGTITRKGDLIEFVAENLTEKIKLSSPLSQADSDSQGSRRSSVRSIVSASSSTSFATSSGVSRSPSSQFQQSPDDIPPIDAQAVIDLENQACRVADSLDLMMGNIRNNLHKMSAITIGCQDAYKRSIDITCDSVDGCIKSMYALMAKVEELSTAMAPVDQLAAQIKEIKRLLELFEAQVGDK